MLDDHLDSENLKEKDEFIENMEPVCITTYSAKNRLRYDTMMGSKIGYRHLWTSPK